MASTANAVRTAILGASGYTGAELARILLHHPSVEIRTLTADRHAGKPFDAVFPQFGGRGLPDLIRIEDADWDSHDLVFCCLPHGTTQEVIASLPETLKAVDLSADFRLSDPADLCRVVRPRAPRAGAPGRRGLRPDRARPRRGAGGQAGRQPGLLSDLRDPAARPAARPTARSRPRSSSTRNRASPAPEGRPGRRACSRRSPRASTPTASPGTATRPRSSRSWARRPAGRSSSTSRRI